MRTASQRLDAVSQKIRNHIDGTQNEGRFDGLKQVALNNRGKGLGPLNPQRKEPKLIAMHQGAQQPKW